MRRAVLPIGTIVGVLTMGLWATSAWSHEGEHGHPNDAAEAPESVTQGDFYPVSEEGAAVFGSAKLIRYHDSSELMVHLSGLAAETTYPSHLHEGSCAVMGPHYRDDPDGAAEPPNELWPSSDPDDPTAGLQSDADGVANGKGSAPWQARPEAAAVMLHDGDTGDMIACADLG